MSVRISCAHRHLAHCCYSYSSPHLPCKAKLLLLLLIRCFSMQFAVCGHECARMASTTIGKVTNAQHRKYDEDIRWMSHSWTCICKYRIARPRVLPLPPLLIPPSIWVACITECFLLRRVGVAMSRGEWSQQPQSRRVGSVGHCYFNSVLPGFDAMCDRLPQTLFPNTPPFPPASLNPPEHLTNLSE